MAPTPEMKIEAKLIKTKAPIIGRKSDLVVSPQYQHFYRRNI